MENEAEADDNNKATITTVTEIEPWIRRKMVSPDVEQLRSSAVQKLRTKMKRGPRNTARGGSIYVYALDNDDISPLFKVGMTTDTVEKRMEQWQQKHKQAKIIVMAQYEFDSDVAWVERVIHLYLDYCRVYRYPIHDEIINDNKKDRKSQSHKLYSVWAATGKPVMEKVYETAEMRKKLIATEKMVEWFAAPFATIDKIITSIH